MYFYLLSPYNNDDLQLLWLMTSDETDERLAKLKEQAACLSVTLVKCLKHPSSCSISYQDALVLTHPHSSEDESKLSADMRKWRIGGDLYPAILGKKCLQQFTDKVKIDNPIYNEEFYAHE